MKKANVQIGATYLVKVAGNLVPAKIDREHDSGGWLGVSVKTGKTIRIKSPQRLRKRLTDPEHMKAVHKADQENARLAEQRAKSPDGRTASERAMAQSATRAKKASKAINDAKPTTKRHTGQRGAKGGDPDGKKMSLLDAATHILSLGAALPMRCKDIVKLAIDRNLWTPGKGKTPTSTLYAAIHREIKAKGDASRFRKVERGKFALAAER